MSHIEKSVYVDKALSFAQGLAFRYRHEFITPEHILSALFNQDPFVEAVEECFCHIPVMEEEVDEYLAQKMEQVPEDTNYELQFSVQSNLLFQNAYAFVESSNAEVLDIPHVVQAMLLLPESWACYFLKKHLKERIPDFISQLVVIYGDDLSLDENDSDEPHGISKNFITCLNEQLENHNPLIGREMELERTIEVLCRKDKNNPLHIGEPGVGKTALAYGLAARIEAGKVPERLKGSRIYELDLGSMLAGTQYRGDFEQRLKSVMKSLSAEKKAILYIDEIHNLIGAGQIGDGSMDASNMLKPYLEQGDIRFIGSTTYEEYNRYFSRSKGMVRRFQQIDIQEPSIDEAIRIIEGLKEKYEEYHHVTYEPGVIEYAVKASARYISDRFLPDKAIDLIDEGSAKIRLSRSGEDSVGKKLKELSDEKIRAINNKDFALALKLREQEKTLCANTGGYTATLTADDIADVVTQHTGIPVRYNGNDTTKWLAGLEKTLSENVIGQEKAVRAVANAVRRGRSGLSDEHRPVGSFIFLGTTGVGKTKCCKELAKALFGTEKALIRFDMSEYSEKHSVSKLIGAPAGYVGYEDGGRLTDRVRKSPYSVVLFDEIEKAHPDVFDILLQVLDDGRLTDSGGRTVDFTNTVIIMTGNIGSTLIAKGKSRLGFGIQQRQEEISGLVRGELEKYFRPEFLGRVDEVVVFNELSCAEYKLICEKMLSELSKQCERQGIAFSWSERLSEKLCTEAKSRNEGARPIAKLIDKNVRNMISDGIISGEFSTGDGIYADIADNDSYSVRKIKSCTCYR